MATTPDHLMLFLRLLEPNRVDYPFSWEMDSKDNFCTTLQVPLSRMRHRLDAHQRKGGIVSLRPNARCALDDDSPYVRCVYADWSDPNKLMPEMPLEPSAVIEYSKWRFFFLWMVDGLSHTQFGRVQRGIAAKLGTDPELPPTIPVPTYSCTLDCASGLRFSAAQVLRAFCDLDAHLHVLAAVKETT